VTSGLYKYISGNKSINFNIKKIYPYIIFYYK
jgi:hypothetical protein